VNKILQAILIGVGKTAASALPGGSVAVQAAEDIIKAKQTPGKADDVDAVFGTGVAVLAVLENLSAVDFANEPDFQAGLYQAKGGFTLMAKAVKNHSKPVPTPAPAV
jgi:hypothetical protein